MSRCAPVRDLTADEHVAELRQTLSFALARIDGGGGVTSCTGLDTETEAALYRYMFDRSPAAPAAVHVAAERQIAGQLDG